MLVFGLNQTIDRTMKLASLEPGTVMRPTEVVSTGGGKAVNVARAAHVLDHPTRLVGPFPGYLGTYARRLLEDEGLDVEAIEVVGEIRSATIILESDGRASVINEPGPRLHQDDWSRCLDAFAASLDEQSSPRPMIAVSGSVPPGTPPDAHRRIKNMAAEFRAFVAMDVTGDRLRDAIDAGVDLVSPNLAEALQVLTGCSGHEPVEPDGEDVPEQAAEAARSLVERGAGSALVSAGRHGVAVVGPGVDQFVHAPTVDEVNPIGAGDSLLGATLVWLDRALDLAVAAQHGVAYAAASVAHPTGGYADRDFYDDLLTEVTSS